MGRRIQLTSDVGLPGSGLLHVDRRTLHLGPRLDAAAEVPSEEYLDAPEVVLIVLGALEAVAFVAIDDVRDRHAALPKRRHDLIGVRLRDAWIVLAVRDEERRAHLVDVI